MNNTTNSVLEGIGIMPDQNAQQKSIMAALSENETNPDMKELLLGMEPVDGMPGYYRNTKTNTFLKYNPNVDTTPTLLNTESLPQNTSKIIGSLQGAIQ